MSGCMSISDALHLDLGAAPARESSVGREVAELVIRYGGPVASGLLDPRVQVFRAPGIDGVIGYRRSWGCAVAIGDPVCAPDDSTRLAEAFRAFCRERGWSTMYAVAGPAFAEQAVARGCAVVEFGEELILDPRRDPQAGGKGRELRKKVSHAKREGASAREYMPGEFGRNRALEKEMEDCVAEWLRGRSGPQIYMAGVKLFEAREGRRWFYATAGDRVVGVLAMLRMEARQGYLLEHLLAVPDAPTGTTELLGATGLAALGADGCGFATFGPAPAAHLGAIHNLGKASEAIARRVYDSAASVFHLDARTRYRRKFQIARTEPAYVVCDPARVGVREIVGVLRAFNVSLA